MAIDMFLKIDGIQGESKDAVYTGEIDISSYYWGMTQSGTMHYRHGRHGKCDIKDISVAKLVDRASPILQLCCARDTHIPEARLVVRKSGGQALEYVTIVFSDVMIVKIKIGCYEGELISENILLNFAKFRYEYQPQQADGSADGGAIIMAHDIKRNITT